MRAPFAFVLGLALFVGGCGSTGSPRADTQATVTESTVTRSTATQSTVTRAGTDPAGSTSTSTSPWPTDPGSGHQEWTVRVIERIPHDPTAYTQGLETTGEVLLEGTGRRGDSELRRLDPATGVTLDAQRLDAELFGEGLTVSGDEIVQLTWEAGRALRYDLASLQPVGEFAYTGEGWGICAGADDLFMTDGSAVLQRRDPATFELLGSVTVRRDGVAIDDLNELECIGDHVAANVWKSDRIVVIDPSNGDVVATIDASALADEIAPTDAQAVLNGIADPGDGTLLLTGKLWPTLFVVVVEPVT